MSDRTLHTRQETLDGGTAPGPLLDTHTATRDAARGPNVLSIWYPHGAAPCTFYLYFTPPALWFICRLTNVVYFSVKYGPAQGLAGSIASHLSTLPLLHQLASLKAPPLLSLA